MRSVTLALFSLGVSLAHVEDESECRHWSNWHDDFGWKCKDYERVSLCEVPQQAGSHYTAYDACCHCGGGVREPEWSFRRRQNGRPTENQRNQCRRKCGSQFRSCQSGVDFICNQKKSECERDCEETGVAEDCQVGTANSCLVCVDGILSPDQQPTPEPTREGGGGGSDFPWYWLLLLLIPCLCIPLCLLLYCMMRPVEEGGQCPPQQIPQDECDECTSPALGGCDSGDCEPMISGAQMMPMNGGGYGGQVGAFPGSNQQAPPGPPGYGPSGGYGQSPSGYGM